ncbi:hypothetical protein GCM10011514_03570 [Emticicia aquatilis]|uniref:Uncharacterized protein n=1 Tax=Emticicia aquatilis TaxID=1537369 RepID=A0A917DJ77_9BACT|nr:hypothetical protein [Emticicia aquatilis]GGD42918.1 hypothetical protein GCM10011514_03570 [Emticicia aquatilis]
MEPKIIDFPGVFYNLLSSIYYHLDDKYYILNALTFIGYIYLIWYKKSDKNFLFFASLVVLYNINRFPSYLYSEINGDEGEWLTGAANLVKEFKPWKSIDNNTSGYFSSWLLTILYYFKVGLNYTTMRLFLSNVLILPSFFLNYYVLCKFFNEKHVRILTVFTIAFLGAGRVGRETAELDFIIFSSECLPFLLLSIIFSTTLYLINGSRVSIFLLFFSGLLVGITPFAKLQSVVLAAFYSLYILFLLVRDKEWKKIAFFSLGVLVIPFITFISIYQNNAFEYFLNAYLFNNLKHLNRNYSFLGIIYHFFVEVPYLSPFLSLFIALFLGQFIYFLYTKNNIIQQNKTLSIFLLLNLLVSIYTIAKPQYPYYHYAWFLLIPIISCFSWSFSFFQNSKIQILPKAIFSIMIVFFWVRSFNLDKEVNDLKHNGVLAIDRRSFFLKNDPFCQKLDKYTVPNERLAIWGWEKGEYFGFFSLLRGTRLFHSSHTIYSNTEKAQSIYRKAYLEDITTYKPVAFIKNENISLTFLKLSEGDFQVKPFNELWQYLHNNYTLVETDTTFASPRELWIRNDRFASKE